MIQLENIGKDFVLGEQTVQAIKSLNLTVKEGEYVAIMGASGSGKSTLLNLLGCLDTPSRGTYRISDDDTTTLNDDELSTLRGKTIGFVFQSYNLLPQYTVLENITLPLLYQPEESSDKVDYARELAELVGLGDRLEHRPTELSGGQQQRVAIARALINDPYLILADEPTGNLDTQTEQEILALFDTLQQRGKTIVVVTHEQEVGERAKRVVVMRDGEIISDEENDR